MWVEPLEDRTLLSTYQWVGGGTNPTSWSDLSAPVTTPDGRILAGSTGFSTVIQVLLAIIFMGGFLAICGWIGYAFASGRNLKQRLTDPAPIDQVPESLVKA